MNTIKSSVLALLVTGLGTNTTLKILRRVMFLFYNRYRVSLLVILSNYLHRLVTSNAPPIIGPLSIAHVTTELRQLTPSVSHIMRLTIRVPAILQTFSRPAPLSLLSSETPPHPPVRPLRLLVCGLRLDGLSLDDHQARSAAVDASCSLWRCIT